MVGKFQSAPHTFANARANTSRYREVTTKVLVLASPPKNLFFWESQTPNSPIQPAAHCTHWKVNLHRRSKSGPMHRGDGRSANLDSLLWFLGPFLPVSWFVKDNYDANWEIWPLSGPPILLVWWFYILAGLVFCDPKIGHLATVTLVERDVFLTTMLPVQAGPVEALPKLPKRGPGRSPQQ